MNYYEKHVGDYLKDTVSLSMLEDGAYNRLLDQYYQTEHPLPAAKPEIYRMARATSAAERKAVDYVVGRFFELTPDGYRQKRCDALIEAFWEKDSKKEAGKENDRERQQRARERRKTLFELLRVRGIVPEYNAKTKELETLLAREISREQSSDGHEHVTRDNTATQSPIPKHQTPEDQDHLAATTSGPKPKTPRKTRLPDDATLTPELAAAAIAYWQPLQRFDLDPDDEFGKFAAYHRSRGNTMLDWSAAWKTWYCNAVKYNHPARTPTPPRTPNQPKTIEQSRDEIAERTRRIAASMGITTAEDAA